MTKSTWGYGSKKTQKQFEKLPEKIRAKFEKVLHEFDIDNPSIHSNISPLKYQLAGQYKIKIGSHRVLFLVDNFKRVIILKAGSRENFY